MYSTCTVHVHVQHVVWVNVGLLNVLLIVEHYTHCHSLFLDGWAYPLYVVYTPSQSVSTVSVLNCVQEQSVMLLYTCNQWLSVIRCMSCYYFRGFVSFQRILPSECVVCVCPCEIATIKAFWLHSYCQIQFVETLLVYASHWVLVDILFGFWNYWCKGYVHMRFIFLSLFFGSWWSFDDVLFVSSDSFP